MTIFFISPVAMRKSPSAFFSSVATVYRRELRQHLPWAHDRPGDEVWEERHEEQVVEVPLRRLDLAAVDVDRVAHRLEREERDAERQDEPEVHGRNGEPEPPAHGRERVDAEVPVLEDAEDAEVVDDRDEEKRFALRRVVRASEEPPDEEVEGAADEDDGDAQQRPPERSERHLLLGRRVVGPHEVEGVARCREQQRACERAAAEQPERHVRDEQEHAVEGTVEEHRG
jgi:hypothetical protein